MSDTADKFEAWGLVEVMGHTRYAGKITEQSIGGQAFVRVDVPAFEDRPAFTKLLGGGSIFAITPTTEQIARGLAQQCSNAPINVYDLPTSYRPRSLPGMDDFDNDDEVV